jgi:hypothetical protein
VESLCACIASLPATPLSHVPIGPKTGGFACSPYGGFALTLRGQLILKRMHWQSVCCSARHQIATAVGRNHAQAPTQREAGLSAGASRSVQLERSARHTLNATTASHNAEYTQPAQQQPAGSGERNRRLVGQIIDTNKRRGSSLRIYGSCYMVQGITGRRLTPRYRPAISRSAIMRSMTSARNAYRRSSVWAEEVIDAGQVAAWLGLVPRQNSSGGKALLTNQFGATTAA